MNRRPHRRAWRRWRGWRWSPGPLVVLTLAVGLLPALVLAVAYDPVTALLGAAG